MPEHKRFFYQVALFQAVLAAKKIRPSLKNSLFPVCRSEKVCPPRQPQHFFCWIWVPKSVSGPRVGKTLCTQVTTMFFLLMIRTKVKFPTDEKSWKWISLQFEKELGCYFILDHSASLINNLISKFCFELFISGTPEQTFLFIFSFLFFFKPEVKKKKCNLQTNIFHI